MDSLPRHLIESHLDYVEISCTYEACRNVPKFSKIRLQDATQDSSTLSALLDFAEDLDSPESHGSL